MKNITQDTVYNLVKKHKDTLSYTREYIQEYQIDTEDGETAYTSPCTCKGLE